ncbi:serine/threonine protein kinase [Colwellia sp. RSH04]|nr:serine/threonine protein kinase [Colwellia sp. RSH04]
MLRSALPFYKTGWFYLLFCFWLVSLWMITTGYFSDINHANLAWLLKQHSVDLTANPSINNVDIFQATQPTIAIFIVSLGLFFIGIYALWRSRASKITQQALVILCFIATLFIMQYSLAIYQQYFIVIPITVVVLLSWPFLIAFRHEELIFTQLQQDYEQLLLENIEECALSNQIDKLEKVLSKLKVNQSLQEKLHQIGLQAEVKELPDIALCLFRWNEQSALKYSPSHEKIVAHQKALLHAKTAKNINERENRTIIKNVNYDDNVNEYVKGATIIEDSNVIAQNYTAPKRTEDNPHKLNWQSSPISSEVAAKLDNTFELVDSNDAQLNGEQVNADNEEDLAATLVINKQQQLNNDDSLESTIVISAEDDLSQTQAKLSVTQAFKGQNFGRYQVEGLLGKGAMGIVYRGVDPKINRHVAIKSLQLSDSVDKEEISQAKQRFFREAETAGGLSHANIVTIYDVGDEGSLGYIAMDLLTGAPLSHFIHADKLLPTPLVYQLMIQITDALDYAHRQHVVHRDIKPGNIIYDDDLQKATITDFGIAYVTDNSRTSTGVVMGSPYYMSPEQITGSAVDGRSDIFSLGATFYQLLSGKLPFEGDSVVSVAYQISNAKHTKITEHRDSLPPSAARITNKALQKDTTKRYQTMQEFKQALINALKRDFKQAPIV